jgi:MFS family permease
LIAILLAGLAEALISGSLEALVYDSHKQEGSEAEFSKVNATNGLLFQIALAIGTAAGGLLYQYWHGLPYLAYAVACGLAGLLSFFFIEPKIDSEKFSVKTYLKQMKRGVQEIVKTRDIAIISLFSILVAGITWSNNLYFFDFILVELKFPDVQRGLIAAGIRIFNVTVLRFLLQNNHIFTKKRSIYFFPVMMTICFLPGIWLRDWWSIIFVAGAVMAGTARFIILAQYLNDVFESKYRATAISAISMGVGIVFVFITWISGPLIEAHGVRFMYSVLGVLSAVLVLPLSFLVVRSFERTPDVRP